MTMRLPALIAAAAALILGGCFGGGAPSELLTLKSDQVRPVGSPRTAGPGEAITVVEPTVPASLATTRVPVYVAPQTIQYLKNAFWADDPSELFRMVVSETIAAGGRVVLDPTQYTHDPGVRLTGQLLMFGLDADRMEAVVLYDAALARGQAAVATNRFEARVPVAAADAVSVAPALNRAANQVAAQVAAWVSQ
ncbi:ABC-type transport auxiliary lipoprotein family protein [Allosphingosinicella sp.]|jgi:cholesterol transport system auxiliary component|uniref:ABC-type transport auxiliary lipoprotein family protein n=1 Tax=Allosphingosinicella sp. TaxID=2823234 RepID=UPI002EFA2F51